MLGAHENALSDIYLSFIILPRVCGGLVTIEVRLGPTFYSCLDVD